MELVRSEPFPLPEAADLYRSRAPLNNVDGLSCPVLLLQGLADPIVPPSQAERFRDAIELHRHGVIAPRIVEDVAAVRGQC